MRIASGGLLAVVGLSFCSTLAAAQDYGQPLTQPYGQPNAPYVQGAPDAGPADSPVITEGQRPSTEARPTEGTPNGIKPEEETITSAPPPAPEKLDESVLLDGHVRSGAFLAGPGSLSFILHHSIMGGVGGLVTMGIGSGFRVDQQGTREAMLAGTLIGAGAGFAVSSWWQFNHWLDSPVANYGIANSLISAMALTGIVDLFTNDPSALAWTALSGAEIGAWLTVGMGGGEFTQRRGLAIVSAAGWAAAYMALFIAIVGTSSSFPDTAAIVDTLLIAPGAGALGMAIAGLQFDPSASQVLRADLFGAGVGGAVLLISGLVLGGFNTATPYVLSLLGSAAAITTVSVFWVEAAEHHPAVSATSPTERYRRTLYRSSARDRKYSNPWW